MDNPSPTSLYRYFDTQGVLLYVGITATGTTRNLQHAQRAEWWPYVRRQEVEHYATRTEAAAREKELIRKFRPPFNKQHNIEHSEARAVYLAYVATAQPDETFNQALVRIGTRLPLVVVHSRNSAGVVAFATLPEHWPVAKEIRLDGQPKVTTDGAPLGHVRDVSHSGMSTVVSCVIRAACSDVQDAQLRLKVITKPRVCLIKSVKVKP